MHSILVGLIVFVSTVSFLAGVFVSDSRIHPNLLFVGWCIMLVFCFEYFGSALEKAAKKEYEKPHV